jgi:hypothetical protein
MLYLVGACGRRKVSRWLLQLLVVMSVVMTAAPVLADSPTHTVGVVDQETGVWYLRDPLNGATTSFYFGNPGDFPIVGDWDCDGVETPGLYRQNDGFVYLRNSNTPGNADVKFFFGNPGDIPLAGDFNGDGCGTVSIYRPSQGRVYIINELGENNGSLGAAEFAYYFGNPGDKPFVGDFDGDGIDTIGLHRESSGLVYFRNSHTQGSADAQFVYGNPADRIVAGDWAQKDTPGTDTVGIFRPLSGTFYLRFANTQGNADAQFTYGTASTLPVAGDFGSLPGDDDPQPDDTSGLEFVAREGWGAVPADVSQLTTHAIDTLTVHHAGDQAATTGPARYRSWQSFHMSRDWGDLAYHFIIGIDGTVYEARDTRYAGATGTNYDPAGHFLVVVEGNFDIDEPTQLQLDSLVTVLAWAAMEFDVSPSTIGGHRDHAATACPGGNLYPYIASGDLETDVRKAINET